MAQTNHDTTGLGKTFPFPTLRLEKKRSCWKQNAQVGKKKTFLRLEKTLGLEKKVGLEKRLGLGITRSG